MSGPGGGRCRGAGTGGLTCKIDCPSSAPGRVRGCICTPTVWFRVRCIGVALFIALSPHWVPHKIRRCYLGSRAPALPRRSALSGLSPAPGYASPPSPASRACRESSTILDHDFEGPRVAPEAQKLTLIPYWPNLSHHLGTPFMVKYGTIYCKVSNVIFAKTRLKRGPTRGQVSRRRFEFATPQRELTPSHLPPAHVI